MPAKKSSARKTSEASQSAMPPYPNKDRRWPELTTYFTKLGKSVSEGDGKAAAKLWDAPAFVVGDEMTMAISSLDEVAQFFSSGRDEYNAAGIDEAVADIQNVRWLTERMVMCEVRWPYVTREGKNVGHETSTYLLRRDDAGNYKMQAAVMMGGTPLRKSRK